MDSTKFEFFGAFNSIEEFIGHDIVHQCMKLNNGWGGLLSANVALKEYKGILSDKIKLIKGRIDKDYLDNIGT